jgi:O-acetyl-ADP-ribose deacetylase (regulator of RNase III)
MSHRLLLTLRRGDLATSSAGALVTSANDSLVGNLSPTYWRFISRLNVDGSIRKLGGDDLERACLEIEPVSSKNVRRDITRWTSGVKKGASACVRCPAGSAISTVATGALQADHVIHAVAPDSEFGYEVCASSRAQTPGSRPDLASMSTAMRQRKRQGCLHGCQAPTKSPAKNAIQSATGCSHSSLLT